MTSTKEPEEKVTPDEPVEEIKEQAQDIPVEEQQEQYDATTLEELFKYFASIHGGMCQITLVATGDAVDILSTEKLIRKQDGN